MFGNKEISMKLFLSVLLNCIVIVALSACNMPTAVPATDTPAPIPATNTAVVNTEIPAPPPLSITLGETNDSQGITLDRGGDVDTQAVSIGTPALSARSSGNGQVISGGDTTPDSYIQFNVDDERLFGGAPTAHVRVEVDYFDQGTDSFNLQYDAIPFGSSDGKFAGGGAVIKTNSGSFKTASFNVCDANFANRDNGADFRISDNADGAEIIRAVRVIELTGGTTNVIVDDFGANPFDEQPDSEAIQSVLDSACSGDTIVFTSPENDPAYKGYLIDKTIFLTGMSAKHDLTFTSFDPNDHALLQATADLKGFVVRLFARSRFSNAGDIDNIDFGNIDVNGGRDVRQCLGSDQSINGVDDNWGSWLPECTQAGDPWCSPGNIGMDGAMDNLDVSQNFVDNPSRWTIGIAVHDLVNSDAECGTALAFGSAGGRIENVTIDTAGDHVHAPGCALTDNDGDAGGWSDGITLFGPAHSVINNTIINPSDVGIVYFGGKDTFIAGNSILVEAGNYGAFAGIALHPWTFGDISGAKIVGNQVSSEGDTRCGGLHTGINLGPHMWGGACIGSATGAVYGNSGSCSNDPIQSEVAACSTGNCQLWAYLPTSATLMLRDNVVTGANINYLIEGVDNIGEFIDENNISQTPQVSDWQAAKSGCNGVTWGALDKVAHHPSLAGYTDLRIHCER